MTASSCRLAWVTDPHLNFVWDKELQVFEDEHTRLVEEVRSAEPDALLIGGDIAEGPELVWHLEQLAVAFAGIPIYFVLGNHDFYRGSIVKGRREVSEFCYGRKDLVYLTDTRQPIALGERVGLVGEDGWADGRFGELEWSRAKISDYAYIEELIAAGEDGRREILNRLGDEAAARAKRVLAEAVLAFPQVVLLTHVPPWLEASAHLGKLSDYEYAPHFASKAMGEAIVEVMQGAPMSAHSSVRAHA